jgi:hypothetical protein
MISVSLLVIGFLVVIAETVSGDKESPIQAVKTDYYRDAIAQTL